MLSETDESTLEIDVLTHILLFFGSETPVKRIDILTAFILICHSIIKIEPMSILE